MFDFPRPAHGMSAPLIGYSPRRSRMAAGALALAATLVAGATPRRASHAPVAAAAHPARRAVDRPIAGHASKKAAPSRAGKTKAPKPDTGYASLASVSRHSSAPALLRHGARPHEAAAKPQPVLASATSLEIDSAADRVVQDRVHAWYQAHSAGSATPVAEAAIDKPLMPFANKVPAPDLSLSAPKATSADFERAKQRQAEVIRAATAVRSTRTTADDDAAFAEASNIPSTAPTERVPAPFVHGELPAALAANVPRPATLAVKTTSPTTTSVDPRGDAEVLSAAGGVPVHIAINDLAPMPKPKTASPLQTPAPAVSAVIAAAAKPKLASGVATSLAESEGDDDIPSTRLSAKVAPAKTPGLEPGPAAQLVNVNLYDGAGKLILLPAMKGSHEILVHQNQMAIADGLDRVEDDGQLAEMRRLKLLVALPDTDAIYPNDRLPLNRRYARPWTVRFLSDLAQAHYARFHTPLIVTSAVRTVAFQRHLVLVNGNAAPPTGDVASPHLYGQAVDIAKRGMSVTELAWMRSYLTPVESAGKIDVEEEFQQSCFHMSVYRRYLGLPTPRTVPDPAPQRTLQQVRAVQSPPALRPLQRAKAVLTKRRRLPTALLATGLR